MTIPSATSFRSSRADQRHQTFSDEFLRPRSRHDQIMVRCFPKRFRGFLARAVDEPPKRLPRVCDPHQRSSGLLNQTLVTRK